LRQFHLKTQTNLIIDMSCFEGLAESIVAALGEEGIEFPQESIQAVIDTYAASCPSSGTCKSTKSKASKSETHTCEYTITSRTDKTTSLCGKNAKNLNEADGMWYCGTEANGHYKSALAASSKTTSPKVASKGAKTGKTAAKTAAPAKPAAKTGKTAAKTGKSLPSGKSKIGALTGKVSRKTNLDFQEIGAGTNIWADLQNYRIVINNDTQEAYGLLDEDGSTILPLSDEAIAFLEVHNMVVNEEANPNLTPRPKAGKSKAPAAKVAPKTAKVAPKVASKTGKVAPKAKTPAPVAAKTGKVAPKAKAVAAPKAKASAPAKGKVAPKAKTPAPAAKTGKAKAKGKTKVATEDEQILEDMTQQIEDVVFQEPSTDEVQEGDTEEVQEEDPELNLGTEEEPNVEENVDDPEETPDIEENEEGETYDDDPAEEEEGEGEE
jgi:hypothetical protein